MASLIYACKECGEEKRVEAGSAVPDCCGEKMHLLPAVQPPHTMTAEADRFEDPDDAFDDGVH